jgi:hypothetical protein
MREIFRTRGTVALLLCFGFLALSARTATDPDFWWHLRTGELILETHQVPHTDPFSFTRGGQPWVNHEWLSDLLIFKLYCSTGWAGLIVAFSAITVCAFFILFLRCDGKPYLAAFLVIGGILACSINLGVRPQMFSLLLASLFLLILEKPKQTPRLLWLLVPLTLIWVNLHAGYALGLVLIALFLAGELLDVAFGVEAWPVGRRNAALLCGVLLACAAVVPLNPYGTRMYTYPFETLLSQGMQSHIQEWFSPNFHDPSYLALLLMILGLCLALSYSRRRLRPSEFLLLSFSLAAALHSIRHIPFFVLIAVPILARLVANLPLPEVSRRFRKQQGPTPGIKLSLNALLVVAFATFSLWRLEVVVRQQREAGARKFPVAAIQFIARDNPKAPILTSYDWGGYFIWKLYPQYQVFIDGRADLYGDELMKEFGNTYNLRDDWRNALTEWHIQTVLLPPQAPLTTALLLDAKWKQVYSDSESVVLIRKTEPE